MGQSTDDSVYDVCVVGGGVVGLSILRFATLAGFQCVLVEAESDLLCWASGSNSGIVCTGVDASGLERALIRDSISNIRGFCKKHNIPTRPCGSLVCQWAWNNDQTEDGEKHTLNDVLQESHDAGDTHASILTSDQVKLLEPNLSDKCLGAVHIPGEIVVDPWLFSIAFAVHARENGAKIFTDWKFDSNLSSFDGKMWTVVRAKGCCADSSGSKPMFLKAKTIVNATGLFSDTIQARVHQQKMLSSKYFAQWTAKPRRGQYRVFKTTEKTKITRPIQPIPTDRTKGIFVFSTLYDQICVGPTALDQESKTDRSVDPAVSRELSLRAQKIVSALDVENCYIGDYVGLRPGSDKRDYQIHTSPNINWVAAAGIRSTGLTASLGIGRHVVRQLTSLLPKPELPSVVQTTRLPEVIVLVQEYHHRGDGSVSLNGDLYKVTHPITRLGWDAMTGIADPKLLPGPTESPFYSKL